MSTPNFSHDFPSCDEEWEYGEIRVLKVNGEMAHLTIRIAAVGGGTVGKMYPASQYWHYSIHSSPDPQRQGDLVMSGSDLQFSGTHTRAAQEIVYRFRFRSQLTGNG